MRKSTGTWDNGDDLPEEWKEHPALYGQAYVYSAKPSWRTLAHDREEFFQWAERALRVKVMEGAREHGDVFQGDPVEHAIEEALDLLFYLWMVRRKLGATHE